MHASLGESLMAEPTLGKGDSPLAIEIQAALTSGLIPDALRIVLSEAAQAEAERLEATPEFSGKPVRLYLEGKGCDGFFYGVAFSDPLPGDLTYQQGKLTLVVDKETFPFLAGSRVEWVDDERGRGFLVENPNHRRFRGKFFKRKAWQDYFTEKKSGNKSTTPEVSP